jgi:hypothetical protein
MSAGRGLSDDQRRTAFIAVAVVVLCVIVVIGALGGGGHAARRSAVNAASTRPAGSAPRIVDPTSARSTTSSTTTATARASDTSASASSSGPRTVIPAPAGFQAQCRYETYPDGAIVPDPSCTPGAVNPAAVANPQGTICAAGFSNGIQPPYSYTEPLKVTDMVKYGSVGPPSVYQEDQLVAPEDGGSSRNPKNLWPEYLYGAGGALQKDKAEDRVHQLICSGKITVPQGASLLEADWMQVLSASSRATP